MKNIKCYNCEERWVNIDTGESCEDTCDKAKQLREQRERAKANRYKDGLLAGHIERTIDYNRKLRGWNIEK